MSHNAFSGADLSANSICIVALATMCNTCYHGTAAFTVAVSLSDARNRVDQLGSALLSLDTAYVHDIWIHPPIALSTATGLATAAEVNKCAGHPGRLAQPMLRQTPMASLPRLPRLCARAHASRRRAREGREGRQAQRGSGCMQRRVWERRPLRAPCTLGLFGPKSGWRPEVVLHLAPTPGQTGFDMFPEMTRGVRHTGSSEMLNASSKAQSSDRQEGGEKGRRLLTPGMVPARESPG